MWLYAECLLCYECAQQKSLTQVPDPCVPVEVRLCTLLGMRSHACCWPGSQQRVVWFGVGQSGRVTQDKNTHTHRYEHCLLTHTEARVHTWDRLITLPSAPLDKQHPLYSGCAIPLQRLSHYTPLQRHIKGLCGKVTACNSRVVCSNVTEAARYITAQQPL